MPRQPATRRTACLTSNGSPVSTGTLTSRVPSSAQQPPETLDGVERDDVLEHFHADNAVVRAGVPSVVEVGDAQETAWAARRSAPAIVHLEVVELRADGLGRPRRSGHQQRQESSVAAAVVEIRRPAKRAARSRPTSNRRR